MSLFFAKMQTIKNSKNTHNTVNSAYS